MNLSEGFSPPAEKKNNKYSTAASIHTGRRTGTHFYALGKKKKKKKTGEAAAAAAGTLRVKVEGGTNCVMWEPVWQLTD